MTMGVPPSTIIALAQADNFMKTASAKQAGGNFQHPAQSQNNLQNTSIFSMKKPS